MIVSIEDISSDFFAFWEHAHDRGRDEQKQLWLALYEGRHRDVFEVYYRRWGDPDQLDHALAHFPQQVAQMRSHLPTVRQQIHHTAALCAQLFAAAERDLHYVVMVGLFGSDGWATRLRGRPTCFCALEHVTDQRRLDILLAHESAHGFHGQTSPFNLETTVLGEGIFLEGLAVLVSAQVIPYEAETSYFWFGYPQTAQGQAVDDWLAECRQRWPHVRQRVLEDLGRTDEACFARYFWAREALLEAGIPVRVGYFVGYRVLSTLYQRYTVAEMARWTPADAVSQVRQTLEQM
jgi:hypothetical protein